MTVERRDRFARAIMMARSRDCMLTGSGQVLDFVPSHVGVARLANQWWMDVLEMAAVPDTRRISTSTGNRGV